METSTAAAGAAPIVPVADMSGMSDADRAVATASLTKAGYKPEHIAAASKVPAAPAQPAKTSDAPATTPSATFLPQATATASALRMIEAHPNLAQQIKDAYKADYGVELDAMAGDATNRAYGIPATAEGYDLRPSVSPDLSPGDLGEIVDDFRGLFHAINLPAQLGQSFMDNILDAATKWAAIAEPADRAQRSLTAKQEAAGMMGAKDWEALLPHAKEAAQAVWIRIPAEMRQDMLDHGVFEDSRVLLQLIRQGELLLSRQGK